MQLTACTGQVHGTTVANMATFGPISPFVMDDISEGLRHTLQYGYLWPISRVPNVSSFDRLFHC